MRKQKKLKKLTETQLECLEMVKRGNIITVISGPEYGTYKVGERYTSIHTFDALWKHDLLKIRDIKWVGNLLHEEWEYKYE